VIGVVTGMLSIFGGTGFVGSYFCKNTTKEYKLIPRESRQPISDEILYMISTTHNYHVFDDLHKDIDTNLSTLVDVLKNLTPGKSVFNFVSSWFVYGDTELPAKETSHCHPKGFYSITKKAAEELIVSYCEVFGINYRILRLCNVYGPGDKGASKQKNALQFLIEKMKKNEEISLYYNGEFYRDYMHATDVARALDLCLKEAPMNQVINIGSGEKILFNDVIKIAYKKTESSSKLTPVAPAAFHQVVQVKDFYMNTDKLKALGFKPSIPLKEGIEELCL
jgi:nucleoside-diphosphate-sugar epimerase